LEQKDDKSELTSKKIETPEQVDSYKKIVKRETPDFTRGIYLTGYTVASERFEIILDQAQEAGINTVVFDVKNMKGDVFLSGGQKDSVRAEKYKPIIDIEKTVKTLHGRNMKAVSRVVVFHDQMLAKNFADLRPEATDGGHWRESKKRDPSWLDPSNRQVQEEILEIIERVVRSGVDEIQMDYIRFPTQGNLENALFSFQKIDKEISLADSNYIPREKVDIIENFIDETKKIVENYGVTLTADLFAIVAWQAPADVSNTGQDIARLSKYLDSVHPMIYSSHFSAGFSFREQIENEPYYIVYQGTILTLQEAEEGCRVIPYIQANNWKVNFNKSYIIAQVRAIEDAEADGYILWSSSNKYESALDWLAEYYSKQ
jgi:hypothetical protein